MKSRLKKVLIPLFLGFIGLCYFLFNNQFWTHLNTDNFETLAEYEGENISGLWGRQILVHKKFVPYLNKIEDLAVKNNIELTINQGYRSNKHPLLGAIVKPSKVSNHLAGFAIDFNIKHEGTTYSSKKLKRAQLVNLPKDLQNFIKDIRQEKGLRWGGDFNTQDPVHIDFPINIRNKKTWSNYARLSAIDYENASFKYQFW
ncbi:M15 family metallopeptidase [Arcticibacterium luteifluviistationis]|uniref:Peptidase M15C domain-containing protein n=1 Tax=Arcticibacterium luteifluviistationis TaxID=1784714 RepID=A0A2Z4GAG8_9BACT|nr:M15 family metallopeptidase [Arcticibacterium luteifluviistationis]AWV98252.1 hypothetical protein DJ013_08755 [Arcticibacterium luteifluviistationis]